MKMAETVMKNGKVYLVGAGPGEPGFITLRAVECLRHADVVFYDYLVNPEILSHAPGTCELICLGRHGQDRIWPQNEINDRLIASARDGKSVIRLKGGDPAIFARSAEEIEALVGARVPFEIVPGITTALAASSCTGISVTHRHLASAVAFVTGHEKEDKPQSHLDYSALANFPGTLVIYMGVTTAPTWTMELIKAGKAANTPAAIVRRCSLPDQTTIRCTLAEVANRLTHPTKIRPPAIVILGPVAAMPSAMSWFDQRPLFGSTVLITRSRDQSQPLTRQFAELGARVFVQPVIRISEPRDWLPVDRAIASLEKYDWLVFSSGNGVRFFFERVFQLKQDIRSVAHNRLAVIGPGTAAELKRYHLTADAQPTEFRAEKLAELLCRNSRGVRFLLLRASRGREVLEAELQESGGLVEQVVVYDSCDVDTPDPEIAKHVRDGAIDWITVTSSAIARSLVNLFGDSLRKAKIASISPVTSGTLRELGFEPDVEARQYTMEGLVKEVRSALEDG